MTYETAPRNSTWAPHPAGTFTRFLAIQKSEMVSELDHSHDEIL